MPGNEKSLNKTNNFNDIVWGYCAQFLNIGSGLILLPLMLHFLGSNDLGLWYSFLAITSLVQLLEFGLQPTITRYISYIFAGAQNINAGEMPTASGEILNTPLLHDMISACRRTYLLISLLAFLMLLSVGSYYVHLTTKAQNNTDQALLSWILYSIGIVINFYFTYLNGIFQGAGHQSIVNKTISINKIAFLLTSSILIVFNLSLNAIIIGNFISIIISRSYIRAKFNSHFKSENTTQQSNKEQINHLIKLLWHSTWRLGVVQLGSFMILRANQLIASSTLGLSAAASYGISLQILSVLSTFSSLPFTLKIPQITAMHVKKDKASTIRIYKNSLYFCWIIFSTSAIFLILLGGPALAIIKSRTHLLDTLWLTILAITLLLELNHTISATFLTTLNKVPFVNASLTSGGSVVVLSVLSTHYTTLGIGGLILSQAIVQALYNNWKWPLTVTRYLRTL
ncbi:O-unit flippase-like protein [Vogesella sp. LYT5W]|uniref:O-unit flippase-like protein n=1 Tax=Vogesella margarita TaxID=2984199 RepID=A0ABT5IR21_9NEIS|nr:O-unit flippase-like protein [Vogesella margarita]MDC7714633.1 O-unit flippase-like protein [Vogesella margarita]